MSMIKYLRLPFEFDIAAMQEEVVQLSSQNWKLHYNTQHYEGDWSALPLRSAGGSMTSILALSGETIFEDTVLMQLCPYLKQVTDTLQCPKLSVRLLRLKAGAVVHAHSDRDLYYEEGEARIHIPVVTNDQVEFYLDEERMYMRQGECWYMNLALMHRLQNNSNTDRVHLVIDCVVNDWMKALFESETITTKQMFEGFRKKGYDDETKRLIIEQLRSQNTETALKMADEMEQQLAAK